MHTEESNMQTYQRIDVSETASTMTHLEPDDSVILKIDKSKWVVESRVGGVYQLRQQNGNLKLVQRDQIKKDPYSTGYSKRI